VKVLITGGAGYIGSTVASACLDSGIVPVILDNLHRGRREFVQGHHFYEGDIADGGLLDRIFADHPDIAATIHSAGLAVVSESVADPIRYYRENVAKTVDLLDHLDRNGCRRFIFSSSASVYESVDGGSLDESCPLAPKSAYARTKAMAEQVLEDVSAAGVMRGLALRYFNPIGADPRMRTGLPDLAPTHALGKLVEAYSNSAPFRVTGVDWPTRDGTGVRDYVHVWDLAQGHVAALQRFDEVLPQTDPQRYEVINLGSGAGTTVRELISAFERVVDGTVTVVESDRRPGDVVGCYTANEKATKLLGWQPRFALQDAIRTALEWRQIWHTRLAGQAQK
jgi:UDP-glucose 4-epimerase